MEESAVLGLVAAVALGTAVIMRRRREMRDEARLRRERLAYHAVTIRPRGNGCAAVMRIKGLRFLGREAPLLPLRTCSAAECNCVYVHYEDRRAHSRRDVYMSEIYRRPAVAVERRSARGRRLSDRLEVLPAPQTP
ncbi:hypothetical protein [Azoarcus olearius]|uniref:Conserved hypothetical membrane protein n=1 Tax=Azoarcus sp. (strain BH72) TaxID=418699 RepID=A1K9F2_AZOSB|nr:hypothetical protein [Azoarcus olearius]CAL95457.1 conserved hypothetical membrane protein [Azoarcus olearius]